MTEITIEDIIPKIHILCVNNRHYEILYKKPKLDKIKHRLFINNITRYVKNFNERIKNNKVEMNIKNEEITYSINKNIMIKSKIIHTIKQINENINIQTRMLIVEYCIDDYKVITHAEEVIPDMD